MCDYLTPILLAHFAIKKTTDATIKKFMITPNSTSTTTLPNARKNKPTLSNLAYLDMPFFGRRLELVKRCPIRWLLEILKNLSLGYRTAHLTNLACRELVHNSFRLETQHRGLLIELFRLMLFSLATVGYLGSRGLDDSPQ